jgi:uncharacterized protein (DUF1501 family)
MQRPMNRRGFLQLGVNTLASSGLLATLGGFERALAAADTTGYRALVCIYLFGGNDSFNTLVPRSTDAYNQYAQSRGSLAVDKMRLLPLHPQTSDGNDYGVHPSCKGLQTLFNNGNLAFVANVGSLVRPVTRAEFLSGRADLPLQLFSHEDQSVQWMTARANSAERQGWGGRIADLLATQGYAPKLSVNISLAGANIWQSAGNVVPYNLGSFGAPELDITKIEGGGGRVDAYLQLLQQAQADPSLMSQQFAFNESRAIDLAHVINDGLKTVPEFRTQFPASHLGDRLKTVARMIGARSQLGAARQIFFVGHYGFDTHDNQLGQQPALLQQLSDAVQAFYDATVEIGAASSVTTFSASEFGRTLTSNGDGTDHAWGAHHFAVGGGVKGANIYGAMPNLTINGPDDVDTGRVIPAQAMDQYGATLSRWFGVSGSDLDVVFPNLGNFDRRDLGFMS